MKKTKPVKLDAQALLPKPGDIWTIKKSARLVLPDARLKMPVNAGEYPVVWDYATNRRFEAWCAKNDTNAKWVMEKGLTYNIKEERLVLILGSYAGTGGPLAQFWRDSAEVFVVPISTEMKHAAEYDAIITEKDSTLKLRCMAECWNMTPTLGAALESRKGIVSKKVYGRVQKLVSHAMSFEKKNPGIQGTGPLRIPAPPDLLKWRNDEAKLFISSVAEPRRVLTDLKMDGWWRSYCISLSLYEALGYRPPRRIMERALAELKGDRASAKRAYRMWWEKKRRS